ncbi:hypothetical protein Q1695_006564 [Nippostrongylus brasiliensis]|nr:hypothetical protein Q1695_006564 [Nippostrongylus brasiliensis]
MDNVSVSKSVLSLVVVCSFPHVENRFYDEKRYPSNAAQIDIWGEVKEQMLIFIHGGFWQEGTRKVVSPIVVPLVKRGIAVAAIGYDYASSSNPLSAVVEQVVTAVKYLLNAYPQVRSITLGGHSAGAQLAFKVYSLLRSPRIQKLALVCGVYELSELPHCEIGTLIGLTPEEAKKNSCDAMELQGTGVEVLILVALKDSPKLIDQNRSMAAALKDCGITTTYQEFPDLDHFSIIHGLRREENDHTKQLLSFIDLM